MIRENPKIQTICRECDKSPCFVKWHEFGVDIPVGDLLVSRSALARATQDWFDGRGSKMGHLPLDLWVLEDGRKLLVDGYHRLVKALIQGKTVYGHRVTGNGYSDYWDVPRADDIFQYRPDLKHGGLELLFPAASLARFAKMRRWKMFERKDNPPRQAKCPCGAKGTRVVETQEGSKSYFCTPHFKRVMELLNKVKPQPYETPIKQSKARSTGTTVSLVAFPKDHPDGKWALICEEHAGIVHFDLKASAISYMASPESWCPGCQGNDPTYYEENPRLSIQRLANLILSKMTPEDQHVVYEDLSMNQNNYGELAGMLDEYGIEPTDKRIRDFRSALRNTLDAIFG